MNKFTNSHIQQLQQRERNAQFRKQIEAEQRQMQKRMVCEVLFGPEGIEEWKKNQNGDCYTRTIDLAGHLRMDSSRLGLHITELMRDADIRTAFYQQDTAKSEDAKSTYPIVTIRVSAREFDKAEARISAVYERICPVPGLGE